jgi:hypothetical protein
MTTPGTFIIFLFSLVTLVFGVIQFYFGISKMNFCLSCLEFVGLSESENWFLLLILENSRLYL